MSRPISQRAHAKRSNTPKNSKSEKAQRALNTNPGTLGIYAAYMIVFFRLLVLALHGIDFPTPS